MSGYLETHRFGYQYLRPPVQEDQSHGTLREHHGAHLSGTRAAAVISKLAEGKVAWAIPWPCIHDFLAVVTHPRIFSPRSTLNEACIQIDAWFESPVLERTLAHAKISDPKVQDARIAAVCLYHGVKELRTADRDFEFFPQLTTRNPLLRDKEPSLI